MGTVATSAGGKDAEGEIVRDAGGRFGVIMSVGGSFVADMSGRFEDFLGTILVILSSLVRGPCLGFIVS